MSYFLDGAVNNGDSVTIIDSNNWLLNRNSSGAYCFDNTLISTAGLSSSASVPTFKVELVSRVDSPYDIVNVKFKDNLTGKYMMVDATGGIVSSLSNDPGATILTLTLQQKSYQKWDPPAVFLTGVGYTIANTTPIYGYSCGGGNITLGNLYCLPVGVFQRSNCNKLASYDVVLNSHWCQTTQNTAGVCSNIVDSWTTQSDCNVGVTYNDCSAGNYCSTQCRAPCQSSGQSCNWNASAQVFQCTGGISVSGNWFTSAWFIGLLIGIGVVAVISLIVWLAMRGRQPKDRYNIKTAKGEFEKEIILDK